MRDIVSRKSAAKNLPSSALLSVFAISLGLGWLQAGGAARAEERSPCALLEAAEVEAVLGGALAGPPFRVGGDGPHPEGEACRYQTPDLRAIDLRVEWTDGGTTFGAMNIVSGAVKEGGLKGVLKLSDGTELTGEWDEARVFLCCEFHALRGEQLVTIDISGSRATVAQAATLADAALRRLNQPLKVDDAASVKAAEERAAQLPHPRPVCELLTRGDAEAVVGAPLTAEPVGDLGSCTYAWTAVEGYEVQMTMNVTWRRGFSEMRLAQSAIGQGMAMLEAEGLKVETGQQTDGPLFDELATTMIATMAVKRDVLFSIETGGFMSDAALALISAAAKKL
jgi:hypothetical protein